MSDRSFPRFARLVLMLCTLSAGSAFAAGDPKHGASVFQQACAACHSIAPGEHMTGPSLADAWGRKAGTAKGFLRYSDVVKKSSIVWNEVNLDKWLTNPARFISGNAMTFPGIQDSKQRADVIAYLKTVAEGKAPQSAQPQGAMGGMMVGGKRTNLKQADPNTQVTAITYCGDTYALKTAAGATHKFWEFNLRFKTDSSSYGPSSGRPVIAGAGMQGDRASVVFSSPGEISTFIKQSCL